VYWERRGQYRYLYKTVRENGHVFCVYLGAGPAAEVLAAADHIDRQERQKQSAQLAALQQRVAAAVVPVLAFNEELETLLCARLLGAGYHTHRGEWRRRQYAKPKRAQ
jgi:hypothetical protein